MTISAPSSYGVIVRCGTPAETAVRSLERARLQYSLTDGELLAVPVAQSPRDAEAFHEELAGLGYREGQDFAMVVVDEGPLGEAPEWLEVTRGVEWAWPEESLATQTDAVRRRLLTPVVLAYSLKKERTLPPLLNLREALAAARTHFRDCVPAAILDAEPAVFVLEKEASFGRNRAEMTVPVSALRSVDQFADGFDELMQRGYAWVNFNLAGLHEGQLIVLIDTPSTGVPGRPGTSLNFSGPCHAVMENRGVLYIRLLANTG